ncbi:MAG: TfoX/Sxy family protein [Clostridiales bacterium]|nr:TfoX/Sxy family protein [Clostridiales bacterium]
MSAKALAAYVHDQLSSLPGISSRAMMGGYVFYCQDRIFGGIYEAGMLIKNVPAARAAMPNAEELPPYRNGKPMLECTLLDDREAFCRMVEEMLPQLPPPKPKKPKEKRP